MPSDERRRAAVRAASLSLPEGSPVLLPWPSLPSRYTRENTLSLSPPVSNLPLPSSAAAAFFSPRHTVVVVGRSLSVRCSRTDGHMRASAGLWWLLLPPGASLVTHAAPRAAHSILLILAPLAQVYPYVRPTLPLPATGSPFPSLPSSHPFTYLLSLSSSAPPSLLLFCFLFLHHTLPLPLHSFSFGLSLSLSFSHSACFLHPATLHRHASGDTRGPTQVMHGPSYIFDPLFGLSFPTGSNVRCLSLSVPGFLTALSPRRPAICFSFSSRCRALERSRLSASLFCALASSSSFLGRVQHAVAPSEHPRCAHR